LDLVVHRSGCPLNLALEVVGDKWSLIVLRDIMFANRRQFRQLLENSEEGISSGVLAARLRKLCEFQLIDPMPGFGHRQITRYCLNEPGIQLVPMIAELSIWGLHHLPAMHPMAVRAQMLEQGGPEMWVELMDDLREKHMGIRRGPAASRPSVLDRLQAAYVEDATMSG
jgi:DNA-binding HxlR family transcriptional regulator